MTDLLELLLGARDRWETVHLTARRWQDVSAMTAAMERHADRLRAQGHGVSVNVRGHGDPTSQTGTRLWIDRRRQRSRSELDTGHGVVLNVRDGKRAWWDAPAVGRQYTDDAPPLEIDPLLDPAAFAVTFDLTATGAGEVAGRPTVTVSAVRPAGGVSQAGFVGGVTAGADEVLLAVDQERGVLLRTEARLEGVPFDINEVTEIAFDQEFDGRLFEIP